MKKLLAICLLTGLLTTFFNFDLVAQEKAHLSGQILDSNNQPIISAVVKSKASNVTTLSDYEGKFHLDLNPEEQEVTIEMGGYTSKTLQYPEDFKNPIIHLSRNKTLETITINKERKSTEISMFSVQKSENMGMKELAKAACCNLSESFETTPSVDAGFTDAVSGYKQITMLGLSGPNVAFTRENIPDINGLASIIGLTFTPGPWVESIQLSKGTGSVVNGFEGVAGQINVELMKHKESENVNLLLNGYQSMQGRSEGNLVWNKSFSEQLNTSVFFHGKKNWMEVDMNSDNFLDQPLGNTVLLGNRWIYFNPKGKELQLGWKVSHLDLYGGQEGFNRKQEQAAHLPWGFMNNINRLDVWAKAGKVYSDKTWKSMGLQINVSSHNQESEYGMNNYLGNQKSLYTNYIYQSIINNTNHKFKTGASFKYDIYDESFNNTQYNRTEIIPGAFFEYTYNYLDKFNLVAGLRGDYNNLYGFFVTPRIHTRYSPDEQTSIRVSLGRAQRTVNIFAENLGYMASARDFEIISNKPTSEGAYGLNPEVAWNMGANATRKFILNYRDGSISFDYYYTHFDNLIMTDIETFNKLYIYNVKEKSFAHSFQAQFDYEVLRKLNLRAAYRFYNVKSTYKDGTLLQKPLQSQHRFFTNIGYETKNGYAADFTANRNGASRIPQYWTVNGNTQEYFSKPFWLLNLQLSKSWKNNTYRIYVGVENLLNVMQDPLIINVQNPHQEGFDAGLIWGSAMGRNIYLGFNYSLMGH